MKVWERIESLRKRMREEDIDVYYIPTNDFHGSEYVSGYFQTREYISGFTGSAGVVIVTLEDAGYGPMGDILFKQKNSCRVAALHYTAWDLMAFRR